MFVVICGGFKGTLLSCGPSMYRCIGETVQGSFPVSTAVLEKGCGLRGARHQSHTLQSSQGPRKSSIDKMLIYKYEDQGFGFPQNPCKNQAGVGNASSSSTLKIDREPTGQAG